MSFNATDQWIGKALFYPPIVKFCRLTRQSPSALSRLFWFAASLDALYHAPTVMSGIFWGGVSLVMMFTAAFRADDPTSSFMPFRLLSVTLWLLDLVQGFRAGEWAGLEFWILVLFAEYAATLRALPPASSVSIRHGAGPSRER
jgi:hypothetical protein